MQPGVMPTILRSLATSQRHLSTSWLHALQWVLKSQGDWSLCSLHPREGGWVKWWTKHLYIFLLQVPACHWNKQFIIALDNKHAPWWTRRYFKKIFRRWKANGNELTVSTAAPKKKKMVVWSLGVCQTQKGLGVGVQRELRVGQPSV